MITNKQQRRRDRRAPSKAVPPVMPNANVVSVAASGGHVVVTFDGTVVPQGTLVPTSWRFGTGNYSVTSYTNVTPSAITMVLTGMVTTGEPYTIQNMDPALLTTFGGYVNGSYGVMT
jgi:hypothetical protein